MEKLNREQALALLKKYNKEAFHLRHSLTVEGVMKHYAATHGYEEDAEFWGIVGLLHDIDFENWPDQHCAKAPELLAEIDAPESLVHARTDRPCLVVFAHAALEELQGHGGQVPQEEVQGQEIRGRL